MATRSRGTSGRPSKAAAPPPFAGSVLEDAEGARNKRADENSGNTTTTTNEQRAETAEVTNTTLERREIPSFSDSREARIAEAAYWRAERRGFAPGHELDDWLEAEREIDGRKDDDVESSGAI